MTPATVTPGRRRSRRRDAAATRQALLAAGTELFAERGYDGVPVAAIAARAGVNKAMINYHFGGKRKLYVAIVSATFGEIVAGIERLAASERPAPEVLRELIALVGDVDAGCDIARPEGEGVDAVHDRGVQRDDVAVGEGEHGVDASPTGASACRPRRLARPRRRRRALPRPA